MTYGFGNRPATAAATVWLMVGFAACGGSQDEHGISSATRGEATDSATVAALPSGTEEPTPPSSEASDQVSEPSAPLSASPAGQEESAGTVENTVLDGVFTAAQADEGEEIFGQICVSCHDEREFSGSGFQGVWEGQTVGDLFEFISTMMPLDNPGILTFEQYAAVISFFLRENGYPVGDTALPPVSASLREIKIVPAN